MRKLVQTFYSQEEVLRASEVNSRLLVLVGIAVAQSAVFCLVCRALPGDLILPGIITVADMMLLLVSLRLLSANDRQGVLDAVLQTNSQLTREQTLLFQFADKVLMLIDENGKVLSANQTIAKAWGFQPSQVIGRPFSCFLGRGQENTFANIMRDSRESNHAVEATLNIASPTKSHLYVNLHVEWSAAKRCFFCAAQDVSAQVMVEKVKSEYQSMLSHDFRSPLESLRLLLEGFDTERFGTINDDGRQCLAAGMISLVHLSELASMLITLDKSEGGELNLVKVMIPLEDLLDQSATLVAPQAQARGVELLVARSDAVVWCDKGAVLQILNNLIGNAIRYAPIGSRIEICATTAMHEVEVAVCDRGPGVPDALKEVIFDRYKTFDNGHGTGLGLAVVSALAKAHGARVGVRDREGGGAIFYFTLFLASEEELG